MVGGEFEGREMSWGLCNNLGLGCSYESVGRGERIECGMFIRFS